MINLKPIAVIHSTRKEVEDDHWNKEKTVIELDSSFSTDAIAGLESFSHVIVTFYMDKVDPSKIETGSRHPRNNQALPLVGIFSQRGKNRPNQIGISIARIIKLDGRRIEVSELDAVDGTPVLDLKPWVKEFGPVGEIFQPQWISDLMKEYW